MLRFVNICLVLGLVALAYVIYQVKYETRALDAQIASLNKQIEEERDGIAVLRAEWSLLNRPERIERLAKKYLKLAPAKPSQLVTVETVTDRDFDRTRGEDAELEAAAAAQAKTKKAAPKPALAASAPSQETPRTTPGSWSATTIATPVEASVVQ
jgi:cell division protein FtsL